nr:MAG TPA: large terminase [Caudoviricetes sp.]
MTEYTKTRQIRLDPTKSREERVFEGVAAWAAFYRANPHRFVKDYLGINLKLFQQMLMVEMDQCNYTAYIAARGQGKSFLISLYCCVRCILYPGTKVCVAAGRRSQSINILELIQNTFMINSPALKREIKNITTSPNNPFCVFENGSIIKVVTANDTARGNRANIVICDEFRMIAESAVDTVLRRLISDERHPPYRDNPKYAHISERNKEIYLTSAWFKDHWSYKKVEDFYVKMVQGAPYFVCGLPYQLSIKEGLYSADQAIEEMSEATFNESRWAREMECCWTGDTEGSFFNYEAINRTRQLKFPMLPSYVLPPKLSAKDMGIVNKQLDEIRIISVDIALMSSTKKSENDATAIFVNRMTPNAYGRYYSNIVYAESHEGETTQKQALRIRRLYEEYSADYIVIDGKGVGAGVVDLLLDDIYNPDTGETYGALSCCNNPDLAARCTGMDAPKALWVINNQTARFNSECAFSLREGFRSGKIRLLTSDYESPDYFNEVRGWGSINPIEKEVVTLPYVNTTCLVDEIVNLKYEDTQSGVKVYEKSGYRKDRYSSLSYNYWVACQLEDKSRMKRKSNIDISELLRCQRAPRLRRR